MVYIPRFLSAALLSTALFHSHNIAGDNFVSSLPITGEVTLGYDDFRGIADGSWNGNTGAFAAANFGINVYDTFGLQAGASYGVYDWYGRGPVAPGINNDVQQQAFVTGGAYYETPCCDGFQGGVLVDWMFNKNFGVFAVNPSIGQLRFQTGYLINGRDELGVWGTVNLNTDHKSALEIPVSFRAVGQVSLFWKHIFENCAETMVWAGLPYRKGLMASGKRAGQYIVGACARAPLTSRLSIDAHGVYMGPTERTTSHRYRNYDANICIGISYAFGIGCGDCCESCLPHTYMPMANNSNFLVDASYND